ncbi:MAG: DUF6057 family protein [Clostridium sp.]|nr:DUF6057 family protein [Clostridium sp.]
MLKIVRWGIGGVFAIFCFSFLYVMQADFMAALQHVLSHGQTVYSPFWGAFIPTMLLSALPFCISCRMSVPIWAVAIFYFPSCLALALLTAARLTPEGTCALNEAWWWSIPVLIVYVLFLRILTQIPESHAKGSIWGRLWPNALLMTFFFAMIGFGSNTDIRLHHELRTARRIQDEDFDGALEVGRKSLEISRRLTAMRCYALGQTGRLGECLFDYPMSYGSKGLLPCASDSVGLASWPEDFYRYMQARPSLRMENHPTLFFRILCEREEVNKAACDYLLCALLLDKDLDGFVVALPRFYPIDANLPRHYKEALILYARVRMSPTIVYEDIVLQTNYTEYLAQRRKSRTADERYKVCRGLYGNTYWFYYHFN